MLHDQNREKYDQGSYIPLQFVADNQGQFIVIDSVLSEEAVLAFEYGYSTAEPNALVIWEAQFGDFVNGAQVVIDQFISSGETKWGRACGLTLMLPHGYEGQGPEHSSARLERFLQLCAEHNMQVCQPTTPAQIFHVLRRQMIRLFRKPLILMTPKSLLRNKEAVSSLDELADGEVPHRDRRPPRRSIRRRSSGSSFCTGKVYYDLLAERRNRELDDIALVRLEQLYPFPHKAFDAEIKRYPNALHVVWCQDEPQNQGAWFFVEHHLEEALKPGQKLAYSGRAPSASPAVGYYDKHYAQQKELLETAALGDTRARATTPELNRIPPRRITHGIDRSPKVPQLSESVAEATLLQWHKKTGEAVARDENLIDIETDKVVLELPAPSGGVLAEIRKADGSTVVAGEVIAVIDTEADCGAASAGAAAGTLPRRLR